LKKMELCIYFLDNEIEQLSLILFKLAMAHLY